MHTFRLSATCSISESSRTGRPAGLARISSIHCSRCLPGLHEHGCSYREPGGFVRRLQEDEGTWLGHVMEHIAIELQNVAGSPVTYGRTRSSMENGHYNMVFQYMDAEVGREASSLALDLIHSLLPDELQPDDAPCATGISRRSGISSFAMHSARIGPEHRVARQSRRRTGHSLDPPESYSLVQFGHGRYQQRIQATTTGSTSNIAVELACDKEETNSILRDLGLPVPKQRLVRNASDAVALRSVLAFRSCSSR